MRALLLFCLVFSGCASLSRSPQAVWIRSDPPGAEIETAAGSVGPAPQYVLIKREKHPRVALTADGTTKIITLPTTYRWQGSFFSNLVFYIFAPVGWVTDLVSGYAWTPQDPPVTSFRTGTEQKESVLPPPVTTALAPPIADSATLSNSAVPLLTRALQKRRYTLLAYDKTLPSFLKRGYDFDGEGSYDDKRMLYEKLDVDAVWKSQLKSSRNGMVLSADLEDTRTQKIIDHLEMPVDEGSRFARTYSRARSLFGLPNAVTLSSIHQTFAFDRGGGTVSSLVTLEQQDSDQWYEWLGQNLSAFSITNIPAYRAGRSGRWQFSIYPILKFSHRSLIARGPTDIDGQTFGRWLIALGAGPELGYQVNDSYFYGNVFENGTYTAIDWRFNHQDSSVTDLSWQLSAEVGYVYSFSESWSVRLFSNVLQENYAAWKEALSQTSRSGIAVTSQSDSIVNNSTVGISLGYSFEPLLVRGYREKENALP